MKKSPCIFCRICFKIAIHEGWVCTEGDLCLYFNLIFIRSLPREKEIQKTVETHKNVYNMAHASKRSTSEVPEKKH